ncbi:hypothetical protein [Sorangium sp. So ce1024]|uniref:hypothetical protein n=1 Tax=Sorangium sp. So ce1024 TaxID=3133327 RepID=UPI003F0E6103
MDLDAQLAELLNTVRIGGGVALAGLAATAGVSFLALRRLRRLEDRQARFEERQARLEAWQEQHGPPLERLALEQDASADPARAAALKHPQRGGSPDAPL